MAKGLPRFISAQLAALWEFHDLDFKIRDIQKAHDVAEFADRFIVEVPCALASSPWHVIFNALRPEQPPDLIFPPEDELFQPLLATPPSGGGATQQQRLCTLLREWNPQDPAVLLRLLLLLKSMYLQHQRKLVELVDDARVRFEVSTIGSIEGLEMYLTGSSVEKAQEVQMSVPLPGVDLSGLQLATPDLSPHLQSPASRIVLQVKFPLQRGEGKPLPPLLKLVPPGAARHVIDDLDQKLPAWTETTCLMEYLPVLEAILNEHVQSIVASVEQRRLFLEALPRYFGRPLEADTVHYRKATTLLSAGMFVYLVHFSLPLQFPKQQPILTFQSSQHFDEHMKPYMSRPYTSYPWSPRWDHQEMVKRLGVFVAEEAVEFKRFCTEALQKRASMQSTSS